MSQINVEERNQGAILHLNGQFISSDETDELRDTLRKIADERKQHLIVNLDKVTYLNSTALGIMMYGYTNFIKRDGKIVLCNVGKSIENLFVITKLSLVFPIYENLDEAIKSLS